MKLAMLWPVSSTSPVSGRSGEKSMRSRTKPSASEFCCAVKSNRIFCVATKLSIPCRAQFASVDASDPGDRGDRLRVVLHDKLLGECCNAASSPSIPLPRVAVKEFQG